MNHCGKYIEKNSQQYVSSAYSALKKVNIRLSYDYAEIKNMEYPELLEVSYDDGRYAVKAGLPYILDLWKREDLLGYINAYAEAVVIFQLDGLIYSATDTPDNLSEAILRDVKLLNFQIEEVRNVEEYFDMYL
ncbi:hypothetical protein YSY43_17360 [Paenibacillus sp. YSY-4.3]